MNIKGNLKYLTVGSAVFLIVYMFLAAIPLGEELFFEPVWTRTLTDTPQETGPLSNANPFILGPWFGYFSEDGLLDYSAFQGRVSISHALWTQYGGDNQTTIINDTQNQAVMEIKESGFTHIAEERVYLFLPGGAGVSEYDSSGKELWKREHSAPITAFDSTQAGTLLGFADGRLLFVQNDGTDYFSFYPGGSDRQIILGAALSNDGSYVTCVSGIDTQRFILLKLSKGQYKVEYHTWLSGDLRRQVFVDFEDNGEWSFFEHSGGLGIINCKNLKMNSIPVEGKIISVGKKPESSLFMVLTKAENTYYLYGIERPDKVVAKTSFTGEDAFLLQEGNTAYLGLTDRISRIDIRGTR